MTLIGEAPGPREGDGTAAGELEPLSRSIGARVRILALGTRLLETVTPRAAATLAYRMWFRTVTPADPPWALPILQEARRSDVEADGGTLATYSWGEGPTVLLVHGWGSHTGYMTGFVPPLLEHGFRVVALDAPAHGRSSGRRTNIFEIRKALLAVIERLPPIRGVVAHSLGSLAVLHAGDHGLEAGTRVLISPGVHLDALVQAFTAQVGLRPSTAEELQRRVASFVGDDFYRDLWDSNDAPTLVVHDRHDRHVPFEEGHRVAGKLPAARLSATEGLGHRSILRDPAVHQETVRFLVDPARSDARASDLRAEGDD